MKKIFFIPVIYCSLLFVGITGCQKEVSNSSENTQPANNNRPPVANAGKDTTITFPANQVLLNGTGSNDPDNNIRNYLWAKKSGPASSVIVNPDSAITIVTNLAKGVYEFILIVTDTKGATSQDICIVRVDSINQQPPPPPNNFFYISMNPHDTVLNLPSNAATLTASTWSITNQPVQPAIASIEWKKVAGPNNYSIQSPGSLSTVISGLSDGLYKFQCKITDTSGWSNISYGGVINVTDTTTQGQEIIIPDQNWDGSFGVYIRIILNQYIPAGKSVKKVFVKQDCDSVFTQAYHHSQAPGNPPYVYSFGFENNEFILYVYDVLFSNCLTNPNNKPDIKIIY
jgi:hypothetical protein